VRGRSLFGMDAQRETVVDAAPLASTYAPAHPLSLAQILSPLGRGTGDPTCRRDGPVIWRTLRTPHGAATLRLIQRGRAVEALAWGAGAEWAIAGVPELLGAGDDADGFDVSRNPFLAEVHRRTPGLRLLRTAQVFEMMLAAVFEQKVTGREAWRAWRLLVTKHGEPAPGPAPAGMHVFPTAEAWRRIPSWEWHRAGVGPERSATIMRVSPLAESLERTLDLGRGGPEVAGKLRSICGVGVWTAAETTQRAHGDPDSVSVGDYHLPATVGWALIGKPVDDDGMLELLSPWPGHRQRVTRLIAASGFRKPSFGPRMTVQDHRWH
jgi:3-methyladenine DNA glycosylase/8-oxoguanine DNA glycosylase